MSGVNSATSINTRHVILFSIASACILIGIKCKKLQEIKKRHRKKKEGSVNIGGIFGMDVGGTLTKIVYFEPKILPPNNIPDSNNTTNLNETPSKLSPSQKIKQSRESVFIKDGVSPLKLHKINKSTSLCNLDSPDHQAALQEVYSYLDSTPQDGVTVREMNLSFYSESLGGMLHFLLFETRNMMSAISMLSSTGITENIRTIGCTGGGAHKYSKEFEEQLDITVHQEDELKCLVSGMAFAIKNVVGECYTYRSDFTSTNDSDSTPPTNVNVEESSKKSEEKKSNNKESARGIRWRRDVKEHTQKVEVPFDSISPQNQFPYLVVNIGSGVSILKVNSPNSYERVSGSSLGGGTYWGLCRLLTSCATFEEVMDIAEMGDATEVDMLVRDIYGGGYENMNLSGSMVASSFGKLVTKESPHEGVKEEDLAIALLMMITNNIGQVSYLNAQVHKCSKIYFVGSFLRSNPISCRRLAFAIDFWSKGGMEALFLSHEGYFGALGTFLKSAGADSNYSNESIDNNDHGSTDNTIKTVRRRSIFGLDSEFLARIREWNPIAYRAEILKKFVGQSSVTISDKPSNNSQIPVCNANTNIATTTTTTTTVTTDNNNVIVQDKIDEKGDDVEISISHNLSFDNKIDLENLELVDARSIRSTRRAYSCDDGNEDIFRDYNSPKV